MVFTNERLGHWVNQGTQHAKSPFLLELLRIRTRNGNRGVEFSIGSVRADATHEAIESGPLLGPYDAFVLAMQTGGDGDLHWEEIHADGTRTSCKSVSRSKQLLLVGHTVPGSSRPLAIILISLKWDASRTLVARWLTSRSEMNKLLTIATFLSDGWEDIVLFAYRHAPERAAADPPEVDGSVDELLSLIQTLNQNPFVASTETLFTSALFACSSNRLHFRFVCDGPDGAEEVVNAVNRTQFDSPLSLSILAGRKDLEIALKESPSLHTVGRVFEQLHRVLPDGCRVETRVSWSLSATSDAPASVRI